MVCGDEIDKNMPCSGAENEGETSLSNFYQSGWAIRPPWSSKPAERGRMRLPLQQIRCSRNQSSSSYESYIKWTIPLVHLRLKQQKDFGRDN